MLKTNVLSGLAIFSGVALLASGLAIAQDPIAQRRAHMKTVGGAAKTGGQMIKGEIPFDAKKASEVMSAVAAAWPEFVKQFPDSAKTGGETTASPKIWENRKDFDAKGLVLKAKAEAASAAAMKDAASFKTAYGEFVGTCKGCHETYRIQKK